MLPLALSMLVTIDHFTEEHSIEYGYSIHSYCTIQKKLQIRKSRLKERTDMTKTKPQKSKNDVLASTVLKWAQHRDSMQFRCTLGPINYVNQFLFISLSENIMIAFLELNSCFNLSDEFLKS